MLVVLVFTALALIFFVLNLGMTILYDQKIAFIASHTATALALQGNGWEYQEPGSAGNFDADAFAKHLASQLGLAPSNVSASVVQTGDIVIATVSGTNLPLLKGFPLLPGKISVRQVYAASTVILPRPTGLLSLTVSSGPGTGPTVAIPCYSGLATGGDISSRAVSPQAPLIPGPGMYDQFSFTMPASTGASLTDTVGTRGMVP